MTDLAFLHYNTNVSCSFIVGLPNKKVLLAAVEVHLKSKETYKVLKYKLEVFVPSLSICYSSEEHIALVTPLHLSVVQHKNPVEASLM